MAVLLSGLAPASGSQIGFLDSVSFVITSGIEDVALFGMTVAVKYANSGTFDVAYALNGGGVSSKYLGASSVNGMHAVTVVLRPTLGWPEPFSIYVWAQDIGGNTYSSSALEYTLAPNPVLVPAPTIPSGSSLVLNPEYRTKMNVHDLIKRCFSEEYVTGLEEGMGQEVVNAVAGVGSRASLAVGRSELNMFVQTAHGGLLAVTSVEFYRNQATLGVTTNIEPGTLVRCSKSGLLFRATSRATLGPADTGPVSVDVQAVDYGYEYNVRGQVTTSGDEVIPGEIDEIFSLRSVPVVFDPELKVRQVFNAVGGRSAGLDGLVAGTTVEPRKLGETDDQLRFRTLDSRDNVTLGSIQRGVDKLLAEYGESACIRAVNTSKFPGLFYDATSAADAVQNVQHMFALDMDGVRNPEFRFSLLLSKASSHDTLMVGVPPISPGSFVGAFLDVPTTSVVKTAYSTHASWDVAVYSAFDGAVDVKIPLLERIAATVRAKKPAGVNFYMYYETVGCF